MSCFVRGNIFVILWGETHFIIIYLIKILNMILENNKEVHTIIFYYLLALLIQHIMKIMIMSIKINLKSSSKSQKAKNNQYDELNSQLNKLRIEKERYNCPSDYSKSAKIDREIQKIMNTISSIDSNSVFSNKKTKETGVLDFFDSFSNLFSQTKTIIEIGFKVLYVFIFVLFYYYNSSKFLLIPYNSFLSYFLSVDEASEYLKLSFVVIIGFISYLINQIITVKNDIMSLTT